LKEAAGMWSFGRKPKEARIPRKNHLEEKIVYALRQAEAGEKVSDICREMGVSQQAFYSWQQCTGGYFMPTSRNCRTQSQYLATLREAQHHHLTGG